MINIFLKLRWSLAVVAIMLLMGCSKPSEALHVLIPTASKSSSVPDSEVSQKVQLALLTIPGIETLDINVSTRKGDVRLVGIVDTQVQIDAALKLVRETDGAFTINNQLTIKQ
ncbi:BON domain-containing protein [Paraglaciecola psychrophila]|uniref:BON domain-containing protein n=1 Tax=Paraglaciecola psychrophila TaxID=326544 RepID=UPI00030B4E39|nr:BON domain-containing protein [Paraglaciecola psychrophila]